MRFRCGGSTRINNIKVGKREGERHMARVLIEKRDKGLSRFYRITGNYLLRGFYGGGEESFGITVHRRILSRGIIDPRYDISRGYITAVSLILPRFDRYIPKQIDLLSILFYARFRVKKITKRAVLRKRMGSCGMVTVFYYSS